MTEIARVHIVCQRPSALLSPVKYAGWRWTARRAAARAAQNLARNWSEETYDLKVQP